MQLDGMNTQPELSDNHNNNDIVFMLLQNSKFVSD